MLILNSESDHQEPDPHPAQFERNFKCRDGQDNIQKGIKRPGELMRMEHLCLTIDFSQVELIFNSFVNIHAKRGNNEESENLLLSG